MLRASVISLLWYSLISALTTQCFKCDLYWCFLFLLLIYLTEYTWSNMHQQLTFTLALISQLLVHVLCWIPWVMFHSGPNWPGPSQMSSECNCHCTRDCLAEVIGLIRLSWKMSFNRLIMFDCLVMTCEWHALHSWVKAELPKFDLF